MSPQLPLVSIRERLPLFAHRGLAAEHFQDYRSDPAQPCHAHDMVEVAFIHAGEGLHELDGAVRPVRPGTVLVVHVNQRHRYHCPHGPLTITNIYHDPAAMAPPLPAAILADAARLLPLHPGLVHARNRVTYLDLSSMAMAELLPILDGLVRETRLDTPTATAALAAWQRLWIITCARLVRAMVGAGMHSGAGRQDLERIRLQLDERPQQAYDLATLATWAGMTPTALCRAFKRYTGHSVVGYLTQRRIERALALLAARQHSVTEVALASGFNDLSHFHRSFRRLVGCTPRSWQQGGGGAAM